MLLVNISTVTAIIAPIISYKLSCPVNETILSLSQSQSITGPLLASDSSLFACNDVYGVGFLPITRSTNGTSLVNSTFAPILESTDSLQGFKDRFVSSATKGFAVELWFVPADDPFLDVSLFTIGQRDFGLENVTTDLRGKYKCNGYDFRIYQEGHQLSASFSDDDHIRSCRSVPISDVKMVPGQMTQVVFSFNYFKIRAYVNGKATSVDVPNYLDTSLKSWNSEYSFQFFSNKVFIPYTHGLPRRVFNGTIHRASIYNQELDDGDVAATFRAGFADIFPLIPTRIDNLTVVEGVTAETTFSIGAPGRPENDFWRAGIEIVSVPTHGALFLAKYEGRPPLGNAVILDFFVDDGFVDLQYKAFNTTYFNTPSTTSKGESVPGIQQESFVYRVLAIDRKTNDVLSTSELIVQPIHVLNMNHKPLLFVPKVATPIEDQSTVGSTRMFSVNNVLLEDIDMNVDKVRVSVWANNGSLYLNQDFLSLADFDECASRYVYANVSNWRCTGRGRSDRNMTFVAQPDDVSKLLNGMVYAPYFGNNDDYINIQVFDGQDGDCLVNDEHVKYGNKVSGIRKGCFAVRGRVYVPASEVIIDAEEASEPNFIEIAFGWFGVNVDVNLLTVMWWIIIVLGSLALYENLLQCLGSCFGSCCLSKKCLTYFSMASWATWLLCCCGLCRPKEIEDDWPEDEEINAVHIRDGYVYERSKDRKPEQWRRTPIGDKLV